MAKRSAVVESPGNVCVLGYKRAGQIRQLLFAWGKPLFEKGDVCRGEGCMKERRAA